MASLDSMSQTFVCHNGGRPVSSAAAKNKLCNACEGDYSESLGKVPLGIFWDMENCRVPADCPPEQVAPNIRNALRHHEAFSQAFISVFSAYGDFHVFSRRLRESCQRTGVTLIDVPNGRKDASDKAILADLFLFGLDHPPPSCIFLISGDVDFSAALHKLCQRGHIISVAAPSQNSVSSTLRNSAKYSWDWFSLAVGKGLVPFQESFPLFPPIASSNQRNQRFFNNSMGKSPPKNSKFLKSFPDGKFIENVKYASSGNNNNNNNSINIDSVQKKSESCVGPVFTPETSAHLGNENRDFKTLSSLTYIQGTNSASASKFALSLLDPVPQEGKLPLQQVPDQQMRVARLQDLKQRLIHLLLYHGGKIEVMKVPMEYLKIFKQPLFLSDYGISKFCELLYLIPNTLFIKKKPVEMLCLHFKLSPQEIDSQRMHIPGLSDQLSATKVIKGFEDSTNPADAIGIRDPMKDSKESSGQKMDVRDFLVGSNAPGINAPNFETINSKCSMPIPSLTAMDVNNFNSSSVSQSIGHNGGYFSPEKDDRGGISSKKTSDSDLTPAKPYFSSPVSGLPSLTEKVESHYSDSVLSSESSHSSKKSLSRSISHSAAGELFVDQSHVTHPSLVTGSQNWIHIKKVTPKKEPSLPNSENQISAEQEMEHNGGSVLKNSRKINVKLFESKDGVENDVLDSGSPFHNGGVVEDPSVQSSSTDFIPEQSELEISSVTQDGCEMNEFNINVNEKGNGMSQSKEIDFKGECSHVGNQENTARAEGEEQQLDFEDEIILWKRGAVFQKEGSFREEIDKEVCTTNIKTQREEKVTQEDVVQMGGEKECRNSEITTGKKKNKKKKEKKGLRKNDTKKKQSESKDGHKISVDDVNENDVRFHSLSHLELSDKEKTQEVIRPWTETVSDDVKASYDLEGENETSFDASSSSSSSPTVMSTASTPKSSSMPTSSDASFCVLTSNASNSPLAESASPCAFPSCSSTSSLPSKMNENDEEACISKSHPTTSTSFMTPETSREIDKEGNFTSNPIPPINPVIEPHDESKEEPNSSDLIQELTEISIPLPSADTQPQSETGAKALEATKNLIHELKQVVSSQGGGIRIDQILPCYETHFGRPLDLSIICKFSLREILEEIGALIQPFPLEPDNLWLILPA